METGIGKKQKEKVNIVAGSQVCDGVQPPYATLPWRDN